jgi:hypothetical protein
LGTSPKLTVEASATDPAKTIAASRLAIVILI